MRSLGEIRAIRIENNLVRLDVVVHGELVRDVIALGPANTFAQLKAGDRVFVERTDGADAEMLASPIVFLMAASPHVIVADSIEARSAGGTAVPLATKADVDAVNARLDALQSSYNVHTHLYLPGPPGPTVPTAIPSPTDATGATVNGTSVLKGE